VIPAWLTADMRRPHERVRAAAGVVSFKYAGIPTAVRVSIGGHPDDTPGPSNGRHARIYVLVDTRNGESATVQFGDDIPTSIATHEEAIEFIYDRARHAWIHELNEAMHVAGVRRRDLHVPGTETTLDLKITEEVCFPAADPSVVRT
jgi:hypothetical protein